MLHPTYAVGYNTYIGAIDTYDQLRSYYSTQLKAFRIYYPLWFFLLDAAVINAYIIAWQLHGHTKDQIVSNQPSFRLRLAWFLVIEGSYQID